MLFDNLGKSIKRMKQLDVVENAALDAEKKVKNDSDYSIVVGDFSASLNKLKKATQLMDYAITVETSSYIEEGITHLRNVITSGVVDADSLTSARQHISKKVNPTLSKEWKTYHQKKTAGSISKLNTLGKLASNPESVSVIKTNIANGGEWNGLSLSDDGVNSRLVLLKKSIDEVDQLEESLNLSDDIRSFIVSVTAKKAKVSDITDNIVKWIKEEKLEDKFIISFKN